MTSAKFSIFLPSSPFVRIFIQPPLLSFSNLLPEVVMNSISIIHSDHEGLLLSDLPINFGDGVERLGGVVHLASNAPLAAALGHRLLRQPVQLILAAAPVGHAAAAHPVPCPLVPQGGGGVSGRVPAEGLCININLIHRMANVEIVYSQVI